MGELSELYLAKRSTEVRPGTFKTVRRGVQELADLYRVRELGSLTLADGRRVLADLGARSVRGRTGEPLSSTTRAHLWAAIRQFLAWAVAEGHVEADPFSGLDGPRIKHDSYAVMTDAEVRLLLRNASPKLRPVLLTCLLTGLRSGEACGVLAAEIIDKGNLGFFLRVIPNELRPLKSDSAAREVPVHDVLAREVLPNLPKAGPVFPDLSVDRVVKLFAKERAALGLGRPGLVFHSTRKWFVTQCERNGVPEHFTAYLVGHQAARSGNRLTYGLYSAGITDAQKREIVDGIRLPDGAVP